MQQAHLDLLQRAPSFAVIAGGTGSYEIFPGMQPAQPARDHVIDGEESEFLAAILAGELIPAQDLSFREAYCEARPLDHSIQADNRGPGV
jgi:hypothetical protein